MLYYGVTSTNLRSAIVAKFNIAILNDRTSLHHMKSTPVNTNNKFFKILNKLL